MKLLMDKMVFIKFINWKMTNKYNKDFKEKVKL